jgi:phosphate transport system permease protein
MRSDPVSDDVHPEHGGGAGPGAPAKEVRPLLKTRRGKSFWGQGEPFVWATGAAVAFTLAVTIMLLWVVLSNGLGVFWPRALASIQLADGRTLLGEYVEDERDPRTDVRRLKYKIGNREFGDAFVWVDEDKIQQITHPDDAFKLDRMVNLNYYGYLKEIQTPGLDVPQDGTLQERLQAALDAAREKHDREIEPLLDRESKVARLLNDEIKYQAMDVKYRKKQLLRRGVEEGSPELAELDARLAGLEEREAKLKSQSHELTLQRSKLERDLRENKAVFVDSFGREKPTPLVDIVRFTCPNQMGIGAKTGHYFVKVWELLSADPREANQDGGVFPAIFGTVLMVFLMAITCFPLGVVAGVYLGEYAKEGPLVRLVRVAVNNLAGIPSIVYGIFGLGFFIYICGGTLDGLFFPERVDAGEPFFGKGCIIWASLTLGLLTIPVVIVSTEEALRAIPRDINESSYALGATKFQTLCRVLLPMSSPGIMTGFILAMARAAGEVAPLMITGAVKSAPVPVDSAFPYVRLDHQFMHLGFHIFDISCKSPNVEATKPMVYVTTLLLLFIVLTMTSAAIWLRNRMRKRYQARAM